MSGMCNVGYGRRGVFMFRNMAMQAASMASTCTIMGLVDGKRVWWLATVICQVWRRSVCLGFGGGGVLVGRWVGMLRAWHLVDRVRGHAGGRSHSALLFLFLRAAGALLGREEEWCVCLSLCVIVCVCGDCEGCMIHDPHVVSR